MSIDDEDEYWEDDDYYDDPDDFYDLLDDDELNDFYRERKETLWNIIRRTWWKYVTRASWQFSKCPQCDRLMILGGHEDHIPF